MERKYELIKEDSVEVEGRTLYRIRALKDFGDLENGVYYMGQGDLGSYIQKEENLSLHLLDLSRRTLLGIRRCSSER